MRQRVGSHKRTSGRRLPIAVSAMGRLMEVYLDALRARQYSDGTLATRATGLRAFAEWCEARGIVRPDEVTRPVVEQYQRWLFHHRRESGRPWSVTTQLGRLSAVRGFFGWLAKTNRIAFNPASDLDLPRRPQRLPRDELTAEEAERVLAQPDTRTALGLRDRAILEMLYTTGARRGELVGLDLGDLDAGRGLAMIREGKGRKDRMVPVGDRALAWVAKYLREARPSLTSESTRGPLFVTETGERLSTSWLTDLVRTYVERSGVAKVGACHLFRHTCATLMLEGGADIRFIQQLLGHAELSTTEIYTRVSIVKLKEIHRATHPARLEDAAEREALLAALDEEAEEEGGERAPDRIRARRGSRATSGESEGRADNRD
jgi:integrase/recombinase XerD